MKTGIKEPQIQSQNDAVINHASAHAHILKDARNSARQQYSDEHASIMLRRAQDKILEQEARLRVFEDICEIDSLTGLMNRKGFIKALKRDIDRVNRFKSQGGLLIMFNFENLHTLRKQYGQDAAHHALALIADTLEQEVRVMDIVARVQEDEFVLLFTDTDMQHVLTRLQNMALRLNRISLKWKDIDIRLSLSLGLKSYNAGSSANRIFEDAHVDLERNRKQAETAFA